METVDVRGLRVAYERAGEGPPLVLLHGGISDRRDWGPQLDGLADAFTVYAWDTPGCGGSDDPPQSWRMRDYADCLVGWLDAMHVTRPHLGGLSWGTTLALEVYRRHPQLPVSLVLTGAYAGWAGSLSAVETDRRLRDFMADLQLPADEMAAKYLPSMFSPAPPPEVADEMAAIMRETRPDGARPMLHAMAEADLNDVLPTIGIPTLLVYGEYDTRSPLEVAREMQAAIPGAELCVIPGAGHCCNLEAPERFNDAVRTFLQGLR